VSVPLQLNDHYGQDNVGKSAPLVEYAAEHWVRHAQFEDVATRIKETEYLFDLDKPYFVAWRQSYDIDSGGRSSSSTFCQFIDPPNSMCKSIEPSFITLPCVDSRVWWNC
jgi:hypothetical protein